MAGTTQKRPAVEQAKPPEAMVEVGNPVFGWLLTSPLHGLVDKHLMLLHFRGRKTGRGYTLPVGRRGIDGRLGVLTSSGWRANSFVLEWGGAHSERPACISSRE